MGAVRTLTQTIFLGAALLSHIGCSAKGSKDGVEHAPAAQPPPPSPPPPDNAQLTSVGLDGMGYRLPAFSSCLRRVDEQHSLPSLNARTLHVDGDLSEWTAPANILDSAGDADDRGDIVTAAVARSGNDLAIMAVAELAPEVSLEIELGAAYLRHEALAGASLLRLRIVHGNLERLVGNDWQALPADLGAAAVAGNRYEVLLGRVLVGEALTYPVWNIRIFSLNQTTGTMIDTTQAVQFGSWLEPDKPPFILTTCKEWYTQLQPIELVEVREADPSGSWHDGPKALGQAQDRVSQLARHAINAVTQMFHGENPPVLQVPVFETLGGTPTGDWEGAFGAVVLSLVTFSSAGTDSFPEGPAFQRIAARLTDLYLLELFPNSPAPLRHTINQALLDHLVRGAFGASYFFDTFRATLASRWRAIPKRASVLLSEAMQQPVFIESLRFAQDDDSTAHQRLASGDADIAWGHVLAGLNTPDQLIDAWKALAKGASTADVFGTSTSAAALSDVGDSDLDGLPDNYEAVYGTDPKKVDTDGDSWSDLAEIVNSENPLAHTSQPNRVMPDGIFDDWLTLFPKKVHVDQGRSNACPVAADIEFYAALASHDELIVGAVAHDFWENDPHASWEAVIDLPKAKRQFLVSVPSDSFVTTIKDPETGKILLTLERAFPQGRKTVEWVFRRQELRLEQFFDEPDSVNIRIRTLFRDSSGQDIYCDETAWFGPYITQ